LNWNENRSVLSIATHFSVRNSFLLEFQGIGCSQNTVTSLVRKIISQFPIGEERQGMIWSRCWNTSYVLLTR
jgi:hypothetical protein